MIVSTKFSKARLAFLVQPKTSHKKSLIEEYLKTRKNIQKRTPHKTGDSITQSTTPWKLTIPLPEPDQA